MSKFTKKAIIESFLSLLNQKKLEKITVADITNECGINRKTFYYYYSDIYAIIDELLEAEITRAFDQGADASELEQNIFQLAQIAHENKKVIYNIFNSMNGDEFRSYTRKIAQAIVRSYTESGNSDFEDLKNQFYVLGLKSFMMEWLRSGMEMKPEDMAIAIRMIAETSALWSVDSSAEQNGAEQKDDKQKP